MDLLLDTNALLWALTGDPRLGRAQAPIVDPRNRIFVSAVSAWEIAIKLGLGKLHVPPDFATWLPAELSVYRFTPLPVLLQHALAVEHLPLHHRDPFDRLLIAQAITEELTLVTADSALDRYAVSLIRC